jgi:TRAP-type C4-dicarboxylate transport system permease small subunit
VGKARRAAPRPGRDERMKARFGSALETLLGAISATVLFLMMLLTAADVAGRYLLNKPIPGGFELTEMMLAALIYCGLPLVSKRREHIVIDTFDPLMSKRVKRGLDVAADVVTALTLAGLGVLIFQRALRVAAYGDTTNVLRLPLAPVAYLMGTMIVVAALIHLWLIFVPQSGDEGRTVI